jgi:hypothetical protein
VLRIAKPVTSQGQQESYTRHHDPERWRFIYDGPAAGSGDRHDIDVLEAVRIAAAFTPPVHAARVHDDARFYDTAGLCDLCDVPYCREHCQVTASCTGTCPQGYIKSLDPHWSAEVDITGASGALGGKPDVVSGRSMKSPLAS